MTADDVVYSFKRIIDPKNPKMRRRQLASLPTSGIRKVDASTVEFHLDAPNAVFDEAAGATTPTASSRWASTPRSRSAPARSSSRASRPASRSSSRPTRTTGAQVPYVDELTIIEFADTTARVNALLGGTVDAISQLPSAQVTVVKGQSGMKVLDAKTGAWQPFTMRIDQKPFDDVRVRQAFRLIVDRKAMIEQAYAGFGCARQRHVRAVRPRLPADLPQRAQDLAQAKSLLKAAGYDNNLDGDSDHVRRRRQRRRGRRPGLRRAGQGRRRHGQRQQGRLRASSTATQYLKWTFAQDFWYTRNYLSQTAMGTMPSAPYNETHWQNAQWLALVKEAMTTRRRDQAQRAHQRRRRRSSTTRAATSSGPSTTRSTPTASKLGGVVPDKSGVPLSSFHFNKFYFV